MRLDDWSMEWRWRKERNVVWWHDPQQLPVSTTKVETLTIDFCRRNYANLCEAASACCLLQRCCCEPQLQRLASEHDITRNGSRLVFANAITLIYAELRQPAGCFSAAAVTRYPYGGYHKLAPVIPMITSLNFRHTSFCIDAAVKIWSKSNKQLWRYYIIFVATMKNNKNLSIYLYLLKDKTRIMLRLKVSGLFVPLHFRSRERKVHRKNFSSMVQSHPGSENGKTTL